MDEEKNNLIPEPTTEVFTEQPLALEKTAEQSRLLEQLSSGELKTFDIYKMAGEGKLSAELVDKTLKEYFTKEARAEFDLTIKQNEATLKEEQAQRKKAEQEAIIDKLTRLNSRGHFENDYPKTAIEYLRHSEGKQDFGFIMLDIDNFKELNDQFGHLTGDEALRKISATIKQSIGSEDSAFRYGGEEIAVVMPSADAASLTDVADRLRANIEATIVLTKAGREKFRALKKSLGNEKATALENALSKIKTGQKTLNDFAPADQLYLAELQKEIIPVTASFGVAALERSNPYLLELADTLELGSKIKRGEDVRGYYLISADTYSQNKNLIENMKTGTIRTRAEYETLQALFGQAKLEEMLEDRALGQKIKITSPEFKQIAEEFVAVGPFRALSQGEKALLEKILQTIEDKENAFAEKMIEIADKALYQSKKTGKNKVTTVTGSDLEKRLRGALNNLEKDQGEVADAA